MSSRGGVTHRFRILLIASLLGVFSFSSVAESKPRNRASKKQNRKKQPTTSEEKPAADEVPEEANPGSDEIEVDRVLTHASKLATEIGSRPANSEASALAAQYIAGQLEELGLEVERHDVGTQVVPAIDLGPLFKSPQRSVTSSDANLVVHLAPKGRAKDKPILLMAHYDSVPGSPGAVDNAVSVGLLLELARVLQRTPPPRPTILAWTAAEENGLVGARALAAEYSDEVGLAVSLDLIGSSGHLTLNGLSSLIDQHWLLWLAEVSKQAKVDIRAPWTHRVVSRLFPEIERSDHGPFAARGVPAVHLYQRSDEAIYLPYHTRHDSMAQVDRASVEDVANEISMMCYTGFAMPKAGDSPGMWLPLPSGPGVTSSVAVQVVMVLFILFAVMSMMNLARAAKGAPRTQVEGRRLGLGSAFVVYVLTWVLAGLVIKLLLGFGGHGLPWIHAPGRIVVAGILMACAIGYVLAAQATRLGTWVGEAQYLMPAIAYTSFVGFFLLAFGIFELAWIVLLPSAALGAVGGSKKFATALIAFVLAALPLLGPLNPSFFREMVFNKFWMTGMPLVAYVGLFLMPYALALVFLLRRYSLPVPRGRTAMGVCAAIIVVAAIVVGTYSAPCSSAEYRLEGLSCEIGK